MKITLKSLTFSNWKGIKNLTTEFNPTETTISGENNIGKTRHFDAYLWLLTVINKLKKNGNRKSRNRK